MKGALDETPDQRRAACPLPDVLEETIREMERDERALAAQNLAQISSQLADLATAARKLLGPLATPDTSVHEVVEANPFPG